MFRIDQGKNEIQKLTTRTFSELGIKERENLQEWIAKAPSVFGEDLLVIQKEFSGFSDTHERLDLLALDKQGALVIIENKLDDSGKDVSWQALKYASYCSGLSKDHIRRIYQEYLDRSTSGEKAEENIAEFFDGADYEDIELNKGVTQRLILVAAKFRKEVTSTVLWLTNFKLRIQCFRAIPYSMGDDLFLNVEQIIPTQDAEEYMIGMADKARDEIDAEATKKVANTLRREFWAQVIQAVNATTNLYQNISPSDYHWIGAGSGVRGVGFNFGVIKTCARVEIYIDRGDQAENKFIFDRLAEKKAEIEKEFGQSLIWQRLDDKRGSRIKLDVEGRYQDRDSWAEMIPVMADYMQRLEMSCKQAIHDAGEALKKHGLDVI